MIAPADESFAFPSRLRSTVRATVATVAHEASAPPRGAFNVNVDGEAVHIPYRLYYDPERLRRALQHAHGVDRRILACLGTRHYDGYVRQASLKQILDDHDTWLMPYSLPCRGA